MASDSALTAGCCGRLDRRKAAHHAAAVAVCRRGLALTLVGVYGVVAQAVAQSTREVGVRIALGASGSAVLSLVVGCAVRIAAAGAVAGCMIAWAAAPTLKGLVYGIAPRDPGTLIVSAVLILITAAVASYLPARVLRRVDVVHALRVK